MTPYPATTSGGSREGVLHWSRTASIVALLALSACSSAPRTLDVRAAPIEVARPDPRPPVPDPAPVDLRDLRWTVVTPDRLPEGDDWSVIGLTPRGYEALAHNQAELLRWMREAAWRLRYYRGELREGEATPG